jgi:hypothetical protein
MMTRNHSNEREQLEMLTIDQLVPDDHLVRKLESAICPFISHCTDCKNNQKLIQRLIWEFYVDEAEHLRHLRDKTNLC